MSVMGVHVRTEQAHAPPTFLRKQGPRRKPKAARSRLSVTDTFNILPLPGDELARWYLCDARCSDKHRMLGQFCTSCCGGSLQTKHTHQEIQSEPQPKHDKFPKVTEEKYPNTKYLYSSPRLPVKPRCHLHVSELTNNSSCLFISLFSFIILFNLTQPDQALGEGLRLYGAQEPNDNSAALDVM